MDLTPSDRDPHVDMERRSRGHTCGFSRRSQLERKIQSHGCSHLACMGSLGLPVHTKVLAGTEESSRPFKRAGDAQDALDVVAEADLEDTFKKDMFRRHIPFVAKLFA